LGFVNYLEIPNYFDILFSGFAYNKRRIKFFGHLLTLLYFFVIFSSSVFAIFGLFDTQLQYPGGCIRPQGLHVGS